MEWKRALQTALSLGNSPTPRYFNRMAVRNAVPTEYRISGIIEWWVTPYLTTIDQYRLTLTLGSSTIEPPTPSTIAVAHICALT